MTDTFKNAGQAGTSSYVAMYTCPAATTAIVISLQAANVHATDTKVAHAEWTDDSDSDAVTRLAENVSIPAGMAVNLIDGRVVLEAGDALLIKATDANVEFSASILEIS